MAWLTVTAGEPLPPGTVTGLRSVSWARRFISSGMVAEKRRVCRSLGSRLSIFLISGKKPMSNMWSASSRTRTSSRDRLMVACPIWSSRRPGQATTISAPSLHQTVQYRQRKCGGLSCAGLGKSHDVPPLHYSRYRLGLYGSRRNISCRGYSFIHGGIEGKLFKIHNLLLSLHNDINKSVCRASEQSRPAAR